MTFEEACHFVISRLETLDHIRREAEQPFWLHALRCEFPDILADFYRPSTQVHTAVADATVQTYPPRAEMTSLTSEGLCEEAQHFPVGTNEDANQLRQHTVRHPLWWYRFLFHDRRLVWPEYMEWLEPPSRRAPLPREPDIPDDMANCTLDEWNAKVDMMLEETRRWQDAVEETHGNMSDSAQ